MFSGKAIISFDKDEVFSYLNHEVNVFGVYLPDELIYLGSYNQFDVMKIA
jgi:hypothetical protein